MTCPLKRFHSRAPRTDRHAGFSVPVHGKAARPAGIAKPEAALAAASAEDKHALRHRLSICRPHAKSLAARCGKDGSRTFSVRLPLRRYGRIQPLFYLQQEQPGAGGSAPSSCGEAMPAGKKSFVGKLTLSNISQGSSQALHDTLPTA